MAKRLLPNGQCWCGCGQQIDLGSFFAPGHDKRAEARLIMEVFGGVPQFLVAFGYGPDGAKGALTSSAAELARWLAGTRHGTFGRLAIEYPNVRQPGGPLIRTAFEIELPGPPNISDGIVLFLRQPGGLFAVPFVDIEAVYKDMDRWVFRISGALNREGHTWTYTPIGEPVDREGARRPVHVRCTVPDLRKGETSQTHDLILDRVAAEPDGSVQFRVLEPDGVRPCRASNITGRPLFEAIQTHGVRLDGSEATWNLRSSMADSGADGQLVLFLTPTAPTR